MGKRNITFLMSTSVIVAILILAFLTDNGHAGVWMQTVPTVAPSATQAPPVPVNTQTAAPIAMNTEEPVVANPTETRKIEMVLDTNTPTATQPDGDIYPTATQPDGDIYPTAIQPGGGSDTTATSSGEDIIMTNMLKIIFYLACGLGLIVILFLVVILFIRRSSKPPSSPPASPSK